jgi:ribosomal protein L33
MLPSTLSEVKILASRLSEAIEKYPQFLKEIEELQKADPSKNLKYLDWQLKQLSLREPLDEVIELTKAFHARGAKLKKRDIYQYKTLGELREAIEELGKSGREKRTGDAAELFQEERSKAKAYGSVVFDNDDVLVVKPKNVEESCYFGRNAKWCISATESQNYFTQYTLKSNQHFYFIINKNLPLKHIFQKVAWQGSPREKPTFWRSDDQSFKKNDADFKRWEAVTPGLEEILEVIKEHLKENPVSHLRMMANEGDLTGLSSEDKQYYLVNKEASPKLLETLASDKDRYVRKAVAGHPDTPKAVLERLASDADEGVRGALATNPAAPKAVLERLASDEDRNVRYAVAANPATPQAVLEKLAGDEDRNVRNVVATNPAAPKAVLEKLAGDEDRNVHYAVATNPAAPKAVLERLASDENRNVRYVVARNPATPQALLEKLASDENRNVRYVVARNPATPQAALERLASDAGSSMREAVATNPAAPKAVLERLASDEDRNVRYAVATNPAAPQAVLERLASDEDRNVRYVVAANPAAPQAVLEKLASDEDKDVRKAVATNPAAPRAVLEKLASDEDEDVRRAADAALEERALSARLDAVVEATTQVRLSAYARLALEEAAEVAAETALSAAYDPEDAQQRQLLGDGL